MLGIVRGALWLNYVLKLGVKIVVLVVVVLCWCVNEVGDALVLGSNE